MTDLATMKLSELRGARERLIGPIAMAWSLLIWLAVMVSLVGILYAAIGVFFALVAQAVVLAAIRGNAVQVTEKQFPELHGRIVKICQRLELAQVPETYVVQAGGLLNAMAAKLLSRNFILIYSDLIEACGDDEGALDFVVAHEIGHIALGHLKRRGLLLPAAITPWLGAGLSRAHEYSSDRCGLAGCGDIESANRAIGILAAGGKMARAMDMDAFMDQRLRHGEFWFAVVELASTHPLLPKRVGALREMLNPGTVKPVGRNPFAYIFAPVFGPLGQPGGGAASGLMVVAIIGILAAIAIPNFLKFQARTRQVEAKTNLSACQTAQEAFKAENGRFGTTFEEIGLTGEGLQTYSMFMGPSAMGPPREVSDEMRGFAAAESYQCVAIGNIDADTTLDVWVVSNESGVINMENDVSY